MSHSLNTACMKFICTRQVSAYQHSFCNMLTRLLQTNLPNVHIPTISTTSHTRDKSWSSPKDIFRADSIFSFSTEQCHKMPPLFKSAGHNATSQTGVPLLPWNIQEQQRAATAWSITTQEHTRTHLLHQSGTSHITTLQKYIIASYSKRLPISPSIVTSSLHFPHTEASLQNIPKRA
ncbi:unnamed protein product [Ixodes pacificus]